MIAAGRGQSGSSSMVSRWKSAVGALPIATSAPARCGRHSSSAAAERVVPICLARSGTEGSRKVQITGLSVGSRARVTPSLTICASHRIAAPFASARRPATAKPAEKWIDGASSTSPAAWIMRTATGSSSCRSGPVRLRTDDGEGLAIDRRAIGFVNVRHQEAPRSATARSGDNAV